MPQNVVRNAQSDSSGLPLDAAAGIQPIQRRQWIPVLGPAIGDNSGALLYRTFWPVV
jgi:hypothetical protein